MIEKSAAEGMLNRCPTVANVQLLEAWYWKTTGTETPHRKLEAKLNKLGMSQTNLWLPLDDASSEFIDANVKGLLHHA